jgi:ketosteroid isomerase-like protein
VATIEQRNVGVIQELYEAFGHGDVPAVLACIDENATWANPYGNGRFPGQWGKPCHGHAEIVRFFQALNEAVEVQGFAPYDFIAQADKVVALINWNGVVRQTGKPYAALLAHIWTLRGEKVVDYIGLDDATVYPF